jgi:hypothetical protein
MYIVIAAFFIPLGFAVSPLSKGDLQTNPPRFPPLKKGGMPEGRGDLLRKNNTDPNS